MSTVISLVLHGTYRDSVFLMKLSHELTRSTGAYQVSAMMATERNKELFARSGLLTPEIEAAHPDDLAIAIDAAGEFRERALNTARELLNRPEAPAYDPKRLSLEDALQARPGTSIALISVPGDYARYETAQALENGIDVMLYSDNISIEDERKLKKLASAKGVLLMGPECGTAIISGVPLGFANHVRQGEVGIIGASGTGIQEVSCLLDRCGLGISHAYGIGGHDLMDDIGGISAMTALKRMADDPRTKLVLLIGTQPGKETRKKMLTLLGNLGKPVIVRYLGVMDCSQEEAAGIPCAKSLAELALMAAQHLAPVLDTSEIHLPDGRQCAASRPAPEGQRRYIRGIFSGGTLRRDAVELIMPCLEDGARVFSNADIPGVELVSGMQPSSGHCFLDMGSSEFTVGRPHPLVSPDAKLERIIAELCDPEVAVVLTS